MDRLRAWAGRIKVEALALYLAARDPRTPWYAKLVGACVAGYAFSPIDLIPDFIPILGYLDDLVVVPAGIALGVRLIPAEIWRECREKAAAELAGGRTRGRAAAAVIVLIWLAALGWAAVTVLGLLKNR